MDHFAEEVQAAGGQGTKSAPSAGPGAALREPERGKKLKNGLLLSAESFLRCQTGGSNGYSNTTTESCQNGALQRDKAHQVNHISLFLKVVWVC